MAKVSMNVERQFRSATIVGLAMIISACSTMSGGNTQYAAHGYLTPGPTSESELIGVYDSVAECRDAADAWASRQVVGNPVYADCFPVDTN